jgi:ribosomal protein S27AE
VLSAFLECPQCGVEFAGVWAVDGDIQDMAEAPVADKTCPNCGFVMLDVEYPGWTFHTEAG